MTDNLPSAGEFLVYEEGGRIKINVRLEDETVWLTQQMMADLFQTSKQNISHHIQSIYDEGELLPEGTVKKYLTVQQEGGRQVRRNLEYYSLDMIISVGYRVKSLIATRFRIWATQRLKEYIVKGFTMDDERLKNPPVAGSGVPGYFDEMLERIRDIRASERRMYLRVKEIFAMAGDYDPSWAETTKFFSVIHPKAGQIIISRSNTPDLVGASAFIFRDYPNRYLPDKLWQTVPKKDVASDLRWLAYYLASSWARSRLSSLATGTSDTMKNITQDELLTLPVLIPPFPEQTAIAGLLSTWDAAMEKTERLIAAKESRFSVLRERFLQKTQQSKRVKLQAITRESTARNGARLGRDTIMAVTKKVGMRPMKEETIAAGIERYKVVRPRAFAYNPMRLNIGSIAMSPFDADVLVSPDYVVFECDESRVLPGYLNHLRFSRHWTNYFESAGNGSVRVRIYYDDLSAFSFDLPPVDVQKRIVDFLDAVGLEIDLLKKQAEAFRRQKRGLMQKLLTGAWRVKVCMDEHGLTPTNTD